MIFQTSFTIDTQGRGSFPILEEINTRLRGSGISAGMCLIFVHHTSASLMLCEDADPEVRSDLERFMPAHIRSLLTGNSLNVPVSGGRCDLGIWQGVYLWEHRTSAHRRKVSVTLYGE